MRHAQLTSRQRVQAMFGGDESDLIPVMTPTSVVTSALMKQKGIRFPDTFCDADRLAALVACAHETFGFDTVAPYLCIHREAAALGCTVDWGNGEGMPAIGSGVKFDPARWAVPANLLQAPPIRTLLEAERLLRRRYPDVALVGKVIGPWTLAYHLFGIHEVLLDVVIEPERVQAVLERLAEVALKLAVAQAEAGVDLLVFADHATSDLVSRWIYEQYILPVEKRCARQLAVLGLPVVLHTCGAAHDRIDLFAGTGFQGFHLHSGNDVRQCLAAAAGRIKLIGNINNPETLLGGTPRGVLREVAAILEAGIHAVAPECALPFKTPVENVRALVRATREARVRS